ncbi:glutamine--fructose-6-phosphate transaminase (isomerizing) [Candidatus Woesearchaeota archaeon]|nr:glutamine--fructose-6-phosphate transaminase (isomerizing) [Candidatus Woesearchaeota archaeon]
MCGIISISSDKPFTSEELLTRLKRLEYRGYDSWGYWNGKKLTKEIGRITISDDKEPVTQAISHTRWATHGGVTQENAHPHRAGKVTIVHNGIIENWREIKKDLEAKGKTFLSETDSEVIVQYLNHEREQGKEIHNIIPAFMNTFKGTFAALIMVDGDENVYAAKRDSPLALGICDGRLILASDIYAFSDITKQAIFFDNDEWAIITPKTYMFYKDGKKLDKQPQTFEWETLEEDKKEYPHFMLKEMHEEPSVNRRLIDSLATDQKESFEKLVSLIKKARKTVFTAAGTAYHASLLGASFLHQCGVNAQAIIASEFENFITIDKDTLVIAVTQSGETMDVIEALKYSKANGATVASIVNVPYSSIERMSSLSLQILAGQEVAVASTKAFTNQASMMLALAQAFGYENGLDALPKKLSGILSLEPELKTLAEELHEQHDLYVLGRKLGYPVAREIALKIKEISYVHAEGMMGGELKHGTIALIEDGVPVISLIYDDDAKMRGSTQEVRARGARVVVIGTTKDADIVIPADSEAEFAILASTVGQLLAYHIALARNCPIDKPRNLAKSVTVL